MRTIREDCRSGLARWFRIHHPVPTARTRLICLPHAGGAASFFRTWSRCFSPIVEVVAVQLPGREDRIDEPPITSLGAVVESLAEAMSLVSDRPYLLFGHSLGAAIAHELCVALRQDGRGLPAHLVVSGREAPDRHRGGTLHCGSDAELSRELGRLNGTAVELIDNPEWCAMALPIIRSDYRLIETYRPRLCAPLGIPITAFVGEQDGELLPGDAEAWADQTAAAFSLRRFPGNHFYLIAQRDGVVRVLQRLLDSLVTPIRSPWPSMP